MTITKTKNGTYRLRIYIPEVKSSLGIDKEVIEEANSKQGSEAKIQTRALNKIDKNS